jgi:hypothetical protein
MWVSRERGATCRRSRVSLRRLIVVIAASMAYQISGAQVLAPVGCPIFHCTVEATGVMSQALIRNPAAVTSNTFGPKKVRNCSGNGARLACLFSNNGTTGTGTVKLFDAATLVQIWDSQTAPDSYDLDPESSSAGQAPVFFDDGHVAAGDRRFHVRYDPDGGVVGRLALTGKGSNFGLTPLSETHGVVTQSDGVLTLVDMTTWQVLGSVDLAGPGGALQVVSPSSASGHVLYVVALDPETSEGRLIAVALNATKQKLRVRSTFVFSGKSQTSPVVVAKSISGLRSNLILLHVPGLGGDSQDRLMALMDTGSSFATAWSIDLVEPLPVSPSIDQNTQSLYFLYKDDWRVFQYNLTSGQPVETHDIRVIGGFPEGFVLNGHIGAARTHTTYTMLLGGEVAGVPGRNGQFIIAFTPAESPNQGFWAVKVRNAPDKYLASWNAAPSNDAGAICPVVSSPSSGLTRVCDH